MAISVEACLVALAVGARTEATLSELLSPDERARAAQFRAERDRSRYVVRRGRLRELLAERLDDRPEALRFSYNAFGKPSLAGTPLHFNLSHSGGFALYVMSFDVAVGCDIEWRQLRLADRRIAEWLFSVAERQALESLQEDAWIEGFFNAWTRREAVLKGRGLGLAQPSDFDVTLRPHEPAAILRGSDGWSIHAREPLPGLHGAIAAQAVDWQLASLPLARS